MLCMCGFAQYIRISLEIRNLDRSLTHCLLCEKDIDRLEQVPMDREIITTDYLSKIYTVHRMKTYQIPS